MRKGGRRKGPQSNEFAFTLDEIGAELGLTRQRVEQIQRQALQKVKAECERRGIDAQFFTEHLADLARLQRTRYTGSGFYAPAPQYVEVDQFEATTGCGRAQTA